MSAYLIADVSVTKPARGLQASVHARDAGLRRQDPGARRRIKVLEGREPGRTVVMEFPSMGAAQAFYDSWQYRRARNAREGAAVMNMFIVQGM